MLIKIPNSSSTCYFDTQWQIYWTLQTTAWAHLSKWICEQKKQLSKHTGGLLKIQIKPCHLLRQVTGVMVNPMWLEAPISLPEQGAVLEMPLISAEVEAVIGFSWFTKITQGLTCCWGRPSKCSLCAGMSEQSLKRFWGNAEYMWPCGQSRQSCSGNSRGSLRFLCHYYTRGPFTLTYFLGR